MPESSVVDMRAPGNEINGHLKAQGLLVSKGSMVDATIIHAPSSTKNQDKARDPGMHQTKKGNQWYFGMKIHVGADVDSGAVHTVEVTAATEADSNLLPKLLRPEDEAQVNMLVGLANLYMLRRRLMVA